MESRKHGITKARKRETHEKIEKIPQRILNIQDVLKKKVKKFTRQPTVFRIINKRKKLSGGKKLCRKLRFGWGWA